MGHFRRKRSYCLRRFMLVMSGKEQCSLLPTKRKWQEAGKNHLSPQGTCTVQSRRLRSKLGNPAL